MPKKTTNQKPGKTDSQTWVHFPIETTDHGKLKAKAALAGKKLLPYMAEVLTEAARQ